MSASRAVYFDLDDTLVEYDRSFDAIFRSALDAYGVEYRPAMFETYQNSFFGYFETLAPNPYRESFDDVVTRFGLDVPADELTATYLDEEVAATVVDEATREVVERVAESHPIGVITNGVPAVQRRKLAHHDLDDFDAVVVSYEVGAHKPDEAIFTAARDAIDADRYLLVGDQMDEDVLPAHEAGFETIYVRGEAGAPDVEVSTITTLRDLLDLG